jgi:hypothetical protein
LNHFIREVIEPFDVRQSIAAVFHVLAALRMHDADMGTSGRDGEDHAVIVNGNEPALRLPDREALVAQVIHDSEPPAFDSHI